MGKKSHQIHGVQSVASKKFHVSGVPVSLNRVKAKMSSWKSWQMDFMNCRVSLTHNAFEEHCME